MTDIVISKDKTADDAQNFADQAKDDVLPDIRTVDQIKTIVQNQTTDLAGIRNLLVKMVITIQNQSLQIEALKRRVGSL